MKGLTAETLLKTADSASLLTKKGKVISRAAPLLRSTESQPSTQGFEGKKKRKVMIEIKPKNPTVIFP